VKGDIDRLMEEADLDGLVVFGAAQHNPYMAYFVGRVHLTDALLVKKRHAEPVLFHRSMERGEAQDTGLDCRLIESFDWDSYLSRAEGDALKARALRLADMIAACDIEGRVARYGRLDLSDSIPLTELVGQALSDITWVSEPQRATVLDKARMTKTPEEIDRIRHMGQVTTDVVAAVAEFLTNQRADDGTLVDQAGAPVTVRRVKSMIRRLVAERDAELPSGLIFSVGRDSALPHSVGDDDQPLPIGETIVFDLYPAGSSGGYYYDFTRTWCLGRASEEIQAVYQDVLQIYKRFVPSFEIGQPTHSYQVQVCETFEALGHPTQLSDPKTQSGYVHGLGHGLGLSVHEPPAFSIRAEGSELLAPGMVFSFEPGLYYPDRGIGVRLEDTLVVNADGSVRRLAEYPLDLVLPVAGS
jgi:Xaa-Pro aminopeptidase